MAGPRTRQKLQPRNLDVIGRHIDRYTQEGNFPRLMGMQRELEERRRNLIKDYGIPGEGFIQRPGRPEEGRGGIGPDSFWNVKANQLDNAGIMAADAGNVMNKYKQFTEKFGDFDIGRGGIEYEKDFDIPWGGTGTFEGYGGGDDYGAGINFSWPLGQSAALDRGIGSTDEYQMAELTQDQIDHMRASDPIKTNLTKQELFQQIKDMEDKGAAGWFGTDIGARDPQEPTTWDEFNEKYDWLEGGGSPYGSEPHTKSYWTT